MNFTSLFAMYTLPCANWVEQKSAKTLVFMRVLGGLPYYNTSLNTAYNTCGFHIYLSPYFANYDAIIYKRGRFILCTFTFYPYRVIILR